jgi:hypothetical protein
VITARPFVRRCWPLLLLTGCVGWSERDSTGRVSIADGASQLLVIEAPTPRSIRLLLRNRGGAEAAYHCTAPADLPGGSGTMAADGGQVQLQTTGTTLTVLLSAAAATEIGYELRSTGRYTVVIRDP